MALTAEHKTSIVEQSRVHDSDTGSPDVQVSMLTERIKGLTEHLRDHNHDHAGRRGLLMMVSRRNRLLRYMSKTQPERYQALIKRLGLRK